MTTKVNWRYHRNGCTSCSRAEEFLTTHDIETKQQVDAKKVRYGADDVIPLLTGMNKMLVARGKKVIEIDLNNDRPDDESLTKLMLGPTGNLRAPTVKTGKTILIGFHPDSYEQTLT